METTSEISLTVPGKLILKTLSGSRSYGLETEKSDYDYRGIYVNSLANIMSIGPSEHVIRTIDPDTVYYPIGHFARLAISGNPTILELLYSDGYDFLSPAGKMLVDARSIFLVEKHIRSSYCGYANDQLQKLQHIGDFYASGHSQGEWRTRYEKHARHTFRIIRQGIRLLTTGEIVTKVENRDEMFALGRMTPEELIPLAETEIAQLRNCVSVVPNVADYDSIAKLVYSIVHIVNDTIN